MNPKLGQDIGRLGQHVHGWQIGAPLIVGEIADPVFQQRLGDRWDALTAELRRHPRGVAARRGQRNLRPSLPCVIANNEAARQSQGQEIQLPTDCRVAAFVATRRTDWRSDPPCGKVPNSQEKETP